MNADRMMLTDAVQDRIKDILPGKAADPCAAAVDNRLFLEAVLQLPGRDRLARPSVAFRQTDSVFKCFRRQALSPFPGLAGKISAAAGALGYLVRFVILPGQAHGPAGTPDLPEAFRSRL